MIPPTSHPAAAEGNYDVDPNDAMLDADPFNLGANLQVPRCNRYVNTGGLTIFSRHYPNAYAYDQHQQR